MSPSLRISPLLRTRTEGCYPASLRTFEACNLEHVLVCVCISLYDLGFQKTNRKNKFKQKTQEGENKIF